MSTLSSFHPVVRRTLAVAAVAGAGVLTASAQTAASAPQPVNSQPVNFQAAAVPSFSSSLNTVNTSSSSSDYQPEKAAETQLASVEKAVLLPGANAMQYGQRRRYGAPRYRGGNTNPDGSEKYTAYVGGGFNSPVGDNSDYLTTSWGLQAGAGRNFNRHFGVNVEFDFDKFGMTGDTINQQAFRYDPLNENGIQGYLDANSHIWSISLQPVYQIYSGQGLGAYLTGGVGFYHKVANFTLPSEQEYCDAFYGCQIYTVNSNVDHYTSNAPGFDGGIGLTYKFSRFANERFYAEARYVYVDNKFRPGITNDTVLTYTGYNYFPENSNTTSYFPIKFGLRF